ncbi:hypothetical protein PCH_Pc22g03230 [Penicillium rubens Wisconsin 54-1255]|uniref:Uncharacterized protein n=1 Tax=Penicillium rubens (strain ATCC 28089 / DSM 1075 / NRRL 1951 / Wisconsin 54-1255) TaxID=500485 RepID=B6HRB2_PENRW|nr:hypothetical protein PCH_Pc22g03230 [Penicillium rubens Wisconsin 54-1255]
MEQGNGQCRARNAIRQVTQPTAKSDANGNASGDGDAIKMQDRTQKRNGNQERPGNSKCVAANKNNRMSQGQQMKAEMQAKYLILVRWQVKEGCVAGEANADAYIATYVCNESEICRERGVVHSRECILTKAVCMYRGERRKKEEEEIARAGHRYVGLGMEDSVWRTQYGGLSMEDSVWRTQYGGLSMEDSVWRTQYGGLSMEDSVWRTQYRGLSIEESEDFQYRGLNLGDSG